jgi:hypothetical protein
MLKPTLPIPTKLTARQITNFFAKVNKIPGGCWLWIGCTNERGYGEVQLNTTRFLAHRVSFTYFKGPIPNNLQLDHLCRVHNCVNPQHLEPVTMRENILRGKTINAFNLAKTHCAKGHEFTPENTYLRPLKSENYSNLTRRDCRACQYESNKTRRLRNAELARQGAA